MNLRLPLCECARVKGFKPRTPKPDHHNPEKIANPKPSQRFTPSNHGSALNPTGNPKP